MPRARLFMLSGLVAATLTCAAEAASGPGRPSKAEIYFRLDNPCPATGATRGPCKGYVIDRVIPLVCGGADEPENMRWLTLADAKAKARWDRIGCRRGRKLVLPGSSTVETEVFPIKEAPAPVEAQALPAGGGATDATPSDRPAADVPRQGTGF